MSIGLIPFMTARLSEDQAAADAMQHEGGEVWAACPATRTGPLGDLEWGEGNCDCGLAARKDRALREVEAKRARLALFGRALTEMDRLLADDDAEKGAQCAAIGCCAARSGVELDAAVYSGHPDYLKERER